MSLSTQQISLVQDSFKNVEPISEQAAEIFYATLFEYDPALKPLFKGDMKEQGRMLMATLKIAVNSLTNVDSLVPVLQKLGVKHVTYGVKVDDYTPVGMALLHTLKTGLGDKYTPELETAWVETYQLVADVMRTAAYPDFNPETYQNIKSYPALHGEAPPAKSA